MMGHQDPPQPKLFYPLLNLETRVRATHPLRAIVQLIDFEFVYEEVAQTYGTKGHVSLPPPVLLKLMLLLVFYNVRSERELMATLPERLDWLWFLGFDLDTAIPDHSVLSKARTRWGRAARHASSRSILPAGGERAHQGPQLGLLEGVAAAHPKMKLLSPKTISGQVLPGCCPNPCLYGLRPCNIFYVMI